MKQVIAGRLYDTETAILIASDDYWDGHNCERHGRNTYLYRTIKRNYFLLHTSLYKGECDYIESVGKECAKDAYEELRDKVSTWEDAFGEAPEIA